MSRRDIFSTLFMSPEASKAKIIMMPNDGDGGGGGGGPSGGTVAYPRITSIVADRNTITLGGWIKFTVNITNYFTSCIITGNGIPSGGISVVSGVPSEQITPTSTGLQTYTVTVTNANMTTNPKGETKTYDINVLVLPQISSFTSTVSGNNVVLRGVWSPTTGTTGKILYGTTTINNVVSGTDYTVAKPTVSTTYTLEVRNEGGWGDQISSTVSVTALNPTINSFTASSQTVDANQSFTITPQFTNGTGVITRTKGVFSNNSSSISCTSGTAITTTITETTTFTLKVTATQ